MRDGEKATLTATLAAAWPNARMSAATVALYELMLDDLEYGVAQQALAQLVCTSKFLPTIAEIRETAASFILGPSRSGFEAWGDVLLAIRRVGYIGVPTFSDPIVADCVRMMGWLTLCKGETPEGVDRAHFAKLYDERQRREREFDVSVPGRLLPGGRGPEQLPPKVRELLAFGEQKPNQARKK